MIMIFLMVWISGVLSTPHTIPHLSIPPSDPSYMEMTYSAVVDAGSTGTRLNIYGFLNGEIRHQGLFTNTPGLAVIDNDEIKRLINELFAHAEPFYNNIKKIPIGAYGTAGFRILDESRSNEILEIIKDELKEYNLKEARVISGEEEGRLALMSLILSKDKNDHGSVGIIDMGGASTQISILERNGKISSESIDLGISTIDSSNGLNECNSEGNKQQESCARHIMSKLKTLGRRQSLGDVDDLYLLSYFHDEFGKIVGRETTTMSEIRSKFYDQCKVLKSNECRNLFYLILFIRNLGIEEDKVVHQIDTNNGINITWASGKGYELDRKYN